MELRLPRSPIVPILLVALVSAAQAPLAPERPAPTVPTVLENTGKPMMVDFHCTRQDIEWAGMSCTADEPCPIYLELTAVESIGTQLFAAGNIHSPTVTLYSELLASDDSGKTWREGYERVRGAGLDHLQFAGLVNGWASGEQLSPLPQDPFLLITTDGGRTWRQQTIFAETRGGSIQQFFFSSKDDGSLVIDRGQARDGERYELYESSSGGRTWSVKEASNQPLRLKQGPASAALWRVEADGPTQSFRIEHQQDGRWTLAAAFAVNLGACTPEPSAVR
jgi:hypothetical protein